MKAQLYTLGLLVSILFYSCNSTKNDSIGGLPSPMGEVGVQVTSSSSNGVQGASATVTSVENGISTFTGEATITNPAILNIVSNIPEFQVVGNKVTVSGLKFKVTTEGVESLVPSYPGVIVNYGSVVGDTYTSGSVKRTVISKSTTDDYPYFYYDIKVIKVEETSSKVPGVKKIIYIANHRFGIVGIEVTLDDNSVAKFAVGGSVQNS